MNARTVQILRWVLKIAITILFAFMVNRGLTHEQIGILGAHVALNWIIAAALLGVLSLWFQLIRWQEILKIEGFDGSLKQAFKTFAWGHLLAFITPGRLGEFGRALALDPHRKADSVASVMVDKTFAVLATALCGVIGMVCQFWTLGSQPPRRLTLFMLAFCIAVVPVLLGIRVWARYAAGSGKISIFIRRLHGTIVAIPRFFNGRIAVYSVLAHAALIIQTGLILSMFGSVSFFVNMVIAAEVYAFMLFLPFFIANIGLREYTFLMVFQTMRPVFHHSLAFESVALGVSLLILIMNILFPAAAGLCIMIIDRTHKSTI
jgi:hypothetical protein